LNTRFLTPLFAAICFATAGFASAQEAPADPAIDPEAEMVLRQWSEHQRKTQSAVIRVTGTIDDVEYDGRKIQDAQTREIALVRPNKLKMVTTGDVPALPVGCTPINVGGASYYYNADDYSQPVSTRGSWNYVVLRPPVGAVVYDRPIGTTVGAIGGVTYYTVGEVNCRTSFLSGRVAYFGVEKP